MRGVLLLAFAVLAMSLHAAEPERKHSVSFEVKVLRSGASTETSQSTNTDRVNPVRSTTTAVFERQKSGQWELEVALRNFAQQPDAVKVDWLFFGQDVGSSVPFAFSDGEKDVVLKPGGGAKVIAVSEKALSTESRRAQVERIATNNERIDLPVTRESAKAGIKIVGWLVRVCSDGKMLTYKASSPRFERYGEDDKRFDFMRKSVDLKKGFVR
jgi:hypothetical protein